MPYRQVKRSGTRNVTKSRDIVKQDRLGYTEIEIHRPKIFFFEFQGMRPNIPHWIFYGNKQVTRYCNTSYSLSDYTDAARTSSIKEPGDSYVTATGFPADLGGATNGGGDNALTSSADGSIKGFFYLQSNADLNWPINTDGTNFSALDVSVLNRNEALSYAAAKFYSQGQYEDWYEYTTTEEVQVSESYSYFESVYYADDDGGGSSNDNSSSWTSLTVANRTVWKPKASTLAATVSAMASNSFKGNYDADGWGE
jgi:hypothetical protein